jgi:PIN domain nuclease of toxin-antitoxin system
VLLDTCALIWLAQEELSEKALDALDHAAANGGVFVSPVSGWEIGLLARGRGGVPKFRFLPDARTWLTRALSRPELRHAPLSATAAFEASSLPEPLHGDPADRLLIATAREMDLALATGDEPILAYGRAGHVKVLAC